MKTQSQFLASITFLWLASLETATASSRRAFAPIKYPSFAPRRGANNRYRSSKKSTGLEFLDGDDDNKAAVKHAGVSKILRHLLSTMDFN